MTYYSPELGSGKVEYTPDRAVLHFASNRPPQTTPEDRLRARGFVIPKTPSVRRSA
jgi:hypothetical protein